MSVRVKICGVTSAADASAAIDAGADLLGLNFFAPSPRYLDLERARVVRDSIGSRATVVGVFVNAARDFIEDRLRALALDMLQFSGDESGDAFSGWPVPTIATHRLKPGGAGSIADRRADYILFDAFSSTLHGGTGERFSLAQLRGLDLSRAFIAGGLTPDNVAEVALLNPFAVDCASGVESSPGVKDRAKLRSFVANAKRAR
jgi:phosphoribosylanthranilate isomerase